MRLGATVTGHLQMPADPVISIPATALTELDQQPAVWIVDPSTLTVAIRKIVVERRDAAMAQVSEGLETGDMVVTSGARGLRAGQKVRLLGSQS
jgi:multidrug efflux pump subunit AcrA (membrane-fusion protein)